VSGQRAALDPRRPPRWGEASRRCFFCFFFLKLLGTIGSEARGNRSRGSIGCQRCSIGSGLDQPVRGNQLRRADKNNQHQLLTNQTSDQKILREEKSADQSINNTCQFDSFRSDLSTMHNPI
jgi:hypothetical protein